MPDHVPKSSPLPKLLIKRNFNSLISYLSSPDRLQNRTKLHARKRSRVPRKTHSTGIRDHVTNAIQLGFGCALPIRTPFVPSFPLPPPPPFSFSLSPSTVFKTRRRVLHHSATRPAGASTCRSNRFPTTDQIFRGYIRDSDSVLRPSKNRINVMSCVYISLESMLILFSIYIYISRQWNYRNVASWNLS